MVVPSGVMSGEWGAFLPSRSDDGFDAESERRRVVQVSRLKEGTPDGHLLVRIAPGLCLATALAALIMAEESTRHSEDLN